MFLVRCEQTGRYLALDDGPDPGWTWVEKASAATWFQTQGEADWFARKVERAERELAYPI